jgi:hypothetical protein
MTKDVLGHDLHCLSNEIKDLIPKLITRMEYNKVMSDSRVSLSIENDKLYKLKTETATFLKELELFVNIH